MQCEELNTSIVTVVASTFCVGHGTEWLGAWLVVRWWRCRLHLHANGGAL